MKKLTLFIGFLTVKTLLSAETVGNTCKIKLFTYHKINAWTCKIGTGPITTTFIFKRRCDTIKSIMLTNKCIVRIPKNAFNGLSNLKRLNLAGNLISVVERDSFKGLINLERLSLEFNRITTIESGAFSELTNLKTLILNNNPISTIGLNAFPENIRKVYIGDSSPLSILVPKENIETYSNIFTYIYQDIGRYSVADVKLISNLPSSEEHQNPIFK